MATQRTPAQLSFHGLGRRACPREGGGHRPFRRRTDRLRWRRGAVARDRFAHRNAGSSGAVFRDYRNPNSVERSVRSLLAQRVYGLALGYEDLNDHDELRRDSLLALLVGKAEYLPKGANPRFVVTNLPADQACASYLYETLYCARGDMENRIKKQQLGRFANRTPCATLQANPLRLYLASFAYVPMQGLRRLGHQSAQSVTDTG